MLSTSHQDLQPYFIFTGSSPALWRISEQKSLPNVMADASVLPTETPASGTIAIAIFSREQVAKEYQTVHGLTSSRIVRPETIEAISILAACWEQGVRFAVLDPFHHSGKQLFDLREVLKRIRQDLANQRSQ
jgi:hypothetical protein